MTAADPSTTTTDASAPDVHEAVALRRLHTAITMQARVCGLMRSMGVSEPRLMTMQPTGAWSLTSHAAFVLGETEQILRNAKLELRDMPVTLPPKVEAMLAQFDQSNEG